MIAIIGRGNVASHLFNALKDKTNVCLVNPHTLEGFPMDPEIILISVSDNAIGEVLDKLPETSAIVAHTAGSIPMDILKDKTEKYGVFYPLQTFTKDTPLDYSEIPVFIEGSSPEIESKLRNLAALFSQNIHVASSEVRKNLHLASVFACNFTNALAGVSENILQDSGLSFKVLLPLMKQTLAKLENLSPKEAQTGPAVRGDTNVINAHLQMLESNPALQQLYLTLSHLINPSLNKTLFNKVK